VERKRNKEEGMRMIQKAMNQRKEGMPKLIRQSEFSSLPYTVHTGRDQHKGIAQGVLETQKTKKAEWNRKKVLDY